MVLGVTACHATKFECVDIDNHRERFQFIEEQIQRKVNKGLLSEPSCDNGAKLNYVFAL